MPNHIVNIVTFSGDSDRIQQLLSAIAGEKEPIDFNKVLKMPRELEGTTSPMPHEADSDTRATYANRQRRFGAADWYEWCCANWGTKWGAYRSKLDGHVLRFETAWACPMPVLRAISARWPTLTLHVSFADEDYGQNLGSFEVRHGVVEAVAPFLEADSVEARRFAYRLHELSDAEIAEYEEPEDEEPEARRGPLPKAGGNMSEPSIVDVTKLPMAYRCIGCDADGVKLWRDYQTLLERQTLKCRACSEAEFDKPALPDRSDAIGWRVPAVPDDSGTFWGYTSVPEGAIAWWRALPEVDSHKQEGT